ncbi:hypothetical protein LOTGIDRAFT_164126 [Lottia gigantea]|uniref:Uncharacterized protein n=1 Tax=Lottia gigantea TaxID=225164 RepID=V4BNR7_LOTGI|nr:hypothetical protein LOTGIDRAFT_164126 [Lottia gigantea]ESO90539.1 hypothetical protein LOTGIDRAFT_164126 [Lottia gigantea]
MGFKPDNPGANQQPVEGGNNNNVADQRCPVINVSPPAQLILGDSPVENWKLYKQAWSNYKVIAGLELRTEEYRKALFLHNLGREAQLIYNSRNRKFLRQAAEQSDLFVPYPPDEATENNAEANVQHNLPDQQDTVQPDVVDNQPEVNIPVLQPAVHDRNNMRNNIVTRSGRLLDVDLVQPVSMIVGPLFVLLWPYQHSCMSVKGQESVRRLNSTFDSKFGYILLG